jgi:hypothetical protein
MSNFEKATREGYKVEKIGSMWFVNSSEGQCVGYFESEAKANKKMDKIGKFYA